MSVNETRDVLSGSGALLHSLLDSDAIPLAKLKKSCYDRKREIPLAQTCFFSVVESGEYEPTPLEKKQSEQEVLSAALTFTDSDAPKYLKQKKWRLVDRRKLKISHHYIINQEIANKIL